MLNVHLGYNYPSPGRKFLWYGDIPRQFIHLKKFRALVDTSKVCRKGVIIQGSQLPSGLPVTGQSRLRKKGGVTGPSVHEPRQRNIP